MPGFWIMPWRYTPLARSRCSSCTRAITRTLTATVAAARPPASLRGAIARKPWPMRRSVARRTSSTPIAMSIAAPATSIAFTPDERQQDQPAQRHAHDRAQRVPGVHPSDRASPEPDRISVRVMRGSVMPAQKVAGSMIARQSA